jgi:LysR family transcriptional activator of nhaA
VDWLNYHHLLYFWTVAREGTIARASQTLRLAPPTISAQIHALEETLGEKLFARAGRRLEPTDTGRLVLRFADEIFGLGREMLDTLRRRPTGRPLRLAIGAADVLPKLVAYRLIEPAMTMEDPVRLVVREDKPERLFAALAIHELDLVLTDAPIPPAVRIRGYSHLLAESPVTLFARPKIAASLRRRFPRSLDGAPLLLPAEATSLRRSLDHWLDARSLRPRIVAEIDDGALLMQFGQAGAGLFPAPSAIEDAVRRQYGVTAVGRLDGVRERYYAVSVERRLEHPAILKITRSARRRLEHPRS